MDNFSGYELAYSQKVRCLIRRKSANHGGADQDRFGHFWEHR